MKDRTFVIIVTFNGMQWIEKCLKSFVNTSVKLDIIVIDNNSSDGTVSYIKKQYPEIILFEQKTNLGFGKANNLGMSYALNNNCDYVFLLNQDAYLEVDSIGRMIEVYKENSEYGILSPIHLNGEGNKLDKNFSNYLRYDSNNYFYHDAINQQLEPVYPFPFVNAAAWLLPVSTLKRIGGFDPIFFHYGEDNNYCQRALFHSLKTGVVTNAFIRHDREAVVKRFFKTDDDKLKNKEIQLKLVFGNLNIDNGTELYSLKAKHLIIILKFFLQFKFKQTKYAYKEYKLIKNLKKEIILSKSINKIIGSHYLTMDY